MIKDRQFYTRYDQLEQRYWWFTSRRKIILDLVRSYIEGDGPGECRVLDIGCGPGNNLAAWKVLGDAYGMDLSVHAAGLARDKAGNRVVVADAEALPYADGSFDVVFALDVVEHLAGPEVCAAEVRRITRPGGLAVFTVPAYQFLYTEHTDEGHVKRYSMREISGMLSGLGYEILKKTYFNCLLFPPMLAQRLWLKYAKPPRKDIIETVMPGVPRVVNSALGGIFGLERLLLRRLDLPFGGSIMCICRNR